MCEVFNIAPVVIAENGVRLRLNIVDTPGYGDQVNNENWYAFQIYSIFFQLMPLSWDPIVKYIKVNSLQSSFAGQLADEYAGSA